MKSIDEVKEEFSKLKCPVCCMSNKFTFRNNLYKRVAKNNDLAEIYKIYTGVFQKDSRIIVKCETCFFNLYLNKDLEVLEYAFRYHCNFENSPRDIFCDYYSGCISFGTYINESYQKINIDVGNIYIDNLYDAKKIKRYLENLIFS